MSRDFSISVDITAPPERAWSLMIDVERWHEWTDSITSVEKLSKGSQASLSIHYGGMPGGGLAELACALNDRYIAMEAAGLKHRSENPNTARTRP